MDFITINEELKFIVKRNKIVRDIEDLLYQKDYTKVETDYFEEYDDYISLNKRKDRRKMVKVQNNKGDVLVLRPDITSNIIKQVILRVTSEDLLKLYYVDSVFSYKKDGSIEQKKQCGVEVIGDKSIQADIELIKMALALFKTFNLDPIVEIGNQKFMNTLIKLVTKSEIEEKQLRMIIQRKSENELSVFLTQSSIKKEYQELLENIFDYQGDLEKIKNIVLKNKLNSTLLKTIEQTIKLKEKLEGLNVRYDISLITTFDYYSGIIFKGYIKGQKNDVLRGGRYDYRTKEYGKEVPALGFSFDLSTLINEVISNG